MKSKLYSVNHIENFRDIVSLCENTYSSNVAFHLKDHEQQPYSVSHGEFAQDIHSFGQSLESLGLIGKRVAIMGENRYEWAVSYLAASCAACVVIPIDKDLKNLDVMNIINVSETDCIIFSGNYRTLFMELSSQLRKGIVYIDMDEEEEFSGIDSYSRLLIEGKKSLLSSGITYQSKEIPDDEMSVILFTSGTTGASKGVMLSQKNICSDIMSTLRSVKIYESDVSLSILPIHHTYECTLGFLAMIYSGASISYTRGLRYISRDIQEYKPTVIVCVPLLLENMHGKITKKISSEKGKPTKVKLAKGISSVSEFFNKNSTMRKKLFEEIHSAFGGRLRLLIVGAAAINPKVVSDLIDFGLRVYLGYGLTECSPLAIGNCDDNMTSDTVGRPIPGVQAKLDSPNEKGIGEIMIKGPNVMLGYYKNPKATEIVLEDGWFRTGDLGEIGKDGNFKVVGRSKNVIVTKNGKNVYPEELEYYLSQSPFVKESVVIGEKSGRNGETEVAVHIFPNIDEIKNKLGEININPDQIMSTLSEVVKGINSKLPSYKSMKDIVIREREFVKTTTQKIKRGELGQNQDKK